ncbi:Diacylglycerol kinase catalytic region [Candidatus Methylobacter favarea]|uniref:Diacylglycerol kinase catalytic region n=1 Tax=Candidatus Methylobacter favarea TaxID=2707345 RepID=A0A8S0XHK7_9GAMM|nr:diacylglycerol kinase family protein [Candidatus Methylobacter favarea]CAA9889811.1 Diacylglycerol kinase catalytic region [Candidatus Methylobacter favarea]
MNSGNLNPSPLYIILNAQSGKNDADKVTQLIEESCNAAHRIFYIYLIEQPEDLLKTAQQVVKSAGQHNGIVVIAGGDGAINTVAHQALQENCRVGLIPQGTFNYFARTHDIPDAPDEALQIIMAEYHEPVQVGLVNDQTFLVSASIGLYPELLETREVFQTHLGRGRVIAFMAGLYTLFLNRQIIHIILETQTERRKLETPSLYVANNRLQLQNIGIAEADHIEQGKLVAIIPQPLTTRLGIMRLLFLGMLGDLGKHENILTFAFEKMNVRLARFLGAHVKVAIDGEIIRLKAPLDFSVSAQALLLIKPDPNSVDSLEKKS